ncbi:low affinity iron permease family protein [Pseudomonas sp.]|jgi:low affinity Fe/Cu permease|uniref:low affinity iron permease family protein n=1 Tax=Pseudomonas sp. TaxID=306 RepID=UPI002E31E68A|nr:low affinity iron permease family protein [Pseudomonas sp.]HEX4547965.1 low affinity iron permease family protein [Pseudomonas sp.]
MKFARFCQALSNWAGSSKTFLLAIALIGVWALTGPYFHYNDTWQLIINTSTTIITFLMVFLIQNTQNRDNDILHLKIDELIRATKDAQNATLCLDKMGSSDLRKLREQYSSLGENDQVSLDDDNADARISPEASVLSGTTELDRPNPER